MHHLHCSLLRVVIWEVHRYICIYIYVYIYMYVYMYICICINVYVYIYIYIYVCMYKLRHGYEVIIYYFWIYQFITLFIKNKEMHCRNQVKLWRLARALFTFLAVVFVLFNCLLLLLFFSNKCIIMSCFHLLI